VPAPSAYRAFENRVLLVTTKSLQRTFAALSWVLFSWLFTDIGSGLDCRIFSDESTKMLCWRLFCTYREDLWPCSQIWDEQWSSAKHHNYVTWWPRLICDFIITATVSPVCNKDTLHHVVIHEVHCPPFLVSRPRGWRARAKPEVVVEDTISSTRGAAGIACQDVGVHEATFAKSKVF
jgi:hypothetical protein